MMEKYLLNLTAILESSLYSTIQLLWPLEFPAMTTSSLNNIRLSLKHFPTGQMHLIRRNAIWHSIDLAMLMMKTSVSLTQATWGRSLGTLKQSKRLPVPTRGSAESRWIHLNMTFWSPSVHTCTYLNSYFHTACTYNCAVLRYTHQCAYQILY